MLFAPTYEDRFDRVADALRLAPSVTSDLIRTIIGEACVRIPTLAKAGKTGRIDQLIGAGAWTDAALALIEHELPAWTLRRLAYEDGEWMCSLSREPNLPTSLDDPAEAAHEILPLAILGAFLEARRRSVALLESAGPAVGQPAHVPEYTVPCDNYV